MTENDAITFTIAKKMNRSAQGAPGLALRSLRGDAASAGAVLLGPDYDAIRDGCERYRMRTGRPLHCRARGKSLEIFSESGLTGESALSALMDFLKDAPFAAEEALDVTAFYSRFLGFDAQPPASDGVPLRLSAQRMFLDLSEMQLTVCAELVDGQTKDTLYSAVGPLLEEYDMGMLKETPGSVVEKPV